MGAVGRAPDPTFSLQGQRLPSSHSSPPFPHLAGLVSSTVQSSFLEEVGAALLLDGVLGPAALGNKG